MKRRDLLKGAAAAGVVLALPSTISRHADEPPPPLPPGAPTPESLFPFKDTDIRFNIRDMMNILKDKDHESWKLAAYPDPSKPEIGLIGAGFNLNVMQEAVHKKGDPADPYQYNDRVRKEPTTETLWVTAGLKKELLDEVRARLESRKHKWGRRGLFIKLADALTHEINEDDAQKLLYISARQAVNNAMAYFADFDHMSGSQQTAASQLVYQMGSKLEGFGKFLRSVNDLSYRQEKPLADMGPKVAAQYARSMHRKAAAHWQDVQVHLIDSDWFRSYNRRAVKVVAMFDPDYDFRKPAAAEGRVKALTKKFYEKDASHAEGPFTRRELLARSAPTPPERE